MNIDKAIEHAFEVSTTCENASCALEHVQLAFWLKQLKELQSILGYSYDLDHLKELAEADKEGRCLLLPAGFEFKNGIYVLCEDISEVKETKEGYTTKSDKAYFWIKTKEMNIFVSVANMPEDTLKYYEEQIEMYNKQSEGE